MTIAITNLGAIASGDLTAPLVNSDTILVDGRHISAIGKAQDFDLSSCETIIDAAGNTAIPGLIDSHVHVTFGDYTPRQKTVGFLESYVHGGTTTAISASEVHTPGRPNDPEGVKALAIAAQRCFQHFRPGGMRVLAGSILLEPGLTEADIAEVSRKGVKLAKAGFGSFPSPYDYVPLIGWCRDNGLITTVHTGGASIPGSSPISADHLIAMNPHVSFHTNGGPVAMVDTDYEKLITQSEIAMQICTAGNLRTALLCADVARDKGALDRLLIATDTPTGSGIMPLGMLYTITHLASLGGFSAEQAIAFATGNNAKVYGLESGFLAVGKLADIVLLDAPLGGARKTALEAIENGDIPAIGGVVAEGDIVFVGPSRNAPAMTSVPKRIDGRFK